MPESILPISFLELESKVQKLLIEKVEGIIDSHNTALDILKEELERDISDTDPDKRKQAVETKEKASIGILKISENMREVINGWIPKDDQPIASGAGPSTSRAKKGMRDG